MPRPPRHSPRRLAMLVLAGVLVAGGQAAAAPSIRVSRDQVQRLEADLARLDARVGAVAAQHDAAVDRLESVTLRLRRAREDLADARVRLREGRERLGTRLRSIYALGSPSDAELLLTSGSVTAAIDARRLMNRVAAQDAANVTAVRDETRRVAALGAQLTVRRAAADRRAGELEARRAELGAAVARRQTLLRSARADLRRALAAERKRQRELAAAAAARAAQVNGTLPYLASASERAVLPGHVAHVFPVQGGANYSDDWMFARAGGRVHQGIDLFAAAGTPLVAVADGTIFRVGYNGLGGWRLWLRDAAGTEFYYAHMSAYAPGTTEGARVTQGTVLGYVGTSGDAAGTPPHCHFEIHPGGGGPVRPHPIVSAWPITR